LKPGAVGNSTVLAFVKLVGGIAAAMFVVWALFYPSSGRRGRISPRFALAAAIFTGILLIACVTWAWLHP
jgi:hypothetical protein